MRPFGAFLATLAIVLAACANENASKRARLDKPLDRAVMEAQDFELVITADKSVYRVGEKPKITASLVNKTGKPVMLVSPADGSDFGRYPKASWTVDAPPDARPLEPALRCGNMNRIEVEQFVMIAPGESLHLTSSWCHPDYKDYNRGPGEYAVQLTYSTDSPNPAVWLGGPMRKFGASGLLRSVRPFLEQVPRITVTSNELRLRFEQAPDVTAP